MKKARKMEDVLQRLRERYPSGLARVLFGTWSEYCIFGEDHVRQNQSRSTYYRHRRLLRDAGVSWIGHDIHVVLRDPGSGLEDFVPLPEDPRHSSGEHPDVTQKLRPHRQQSED